LTIASRGWNIRRMGADFQYLVDRPALLIIILFVGAMIGIGIEKFDRWQKRRRWQDRQRRQGKVVPFGPKADPIPKKIPDAADQLRTVMKADFKAQHLSAFKIVDHSL
jgi:hypothetical protein